MPKAIKNVAIKRICFIVRIILCDIFVNVGLNDIKYDFTSNLLKLGNE